MLAALASATAPSIPGLILPRENTDATHRGDGGENDAVQSQRISSQ